MSNRKKPKEKVKIFTKKKHYHTPENEFIRNLQAKYDEKMDLKNVKSFSDFPLSPKTLKGLKSSGYSKPTDIQKETLMLALAGKDILGAAQTGSGKTLAFIIPILEKLFCKQWTHFDGLGGLVITPTRELAYQIFETLKKVGIHHDFSAGLIIGGKDLKFERERMGQCNIIICTPGRLLQHMDENPLFDCLNLQILVLDEADRCLDMGFEQTMNAIIANLPMKRQTLLFSATQTKSVKDLARLSLKDPCYIAVHENAKHSTPSGLHQTYVVCELKNKVTLLWNFIKTHLKQKVIIFMSSCKQVKYIFEIFSKLRPGTSLMALYGTLHQLKRMEIYESFSRKSSAVLFATDLAARGLDFPQVHWVVQVDCPEDSATYIHRVGRTARYHKGGESLLFLLPSELPMLEDLVARKIPIEKIEMNPMKLNDPVRKMELFLAGNESLKESAKRAFVAYAKAIALMKNKKIFNVEALDTDSFAYSLGLPMPPRIRFLQRRIAKQNTKNLGSSQIKYSDSKKTYFNDEDEFPTYSNMSATEAISERVQDINVYDAASTQVTHWGNDGMSSDEDDETPFADNKAVDINVPENLDLDETIFGSGSTSNNNKPTTKAALVKKLMNKHIIQNKKITFDATGDSVVPDIKEAKSQLAQEYEDENMGGIDIEKAKLVLREQDKYDRELFSSKVKARHREIKRKLKEKKMKEKQEEMDDFGEDESEVEPDLSWLPDPDKLYGDKKELDQERINEVENNKMEVDALLITRKTKKRKKSGMKEPPEKKYKNREKIEKLNASLTVNEAEELALMLLGK